MLVYLTTWLGFVAGTWALFKIAEDTINDTTRKRISNWLMNVSLSEAVSHWPEAFIETFDAVFGKRHLTFKCFRRSSIVSISLVILLMLLHCTLYPESEWAQMMQSPIGPIIVMVATLFLAIVVNLLPDYISLLETRLILRYISQTNSVKRLILFLLLDFFLTWLIFYAYLGIIALVILVVHPSSVKPYSIWEELSLIPETMSLRCVIGIFWYSTFFTSIWIWLYFISTRIIRVFSRLESHMSNLISILDVEKKPLSAIGFVTCVLVSIIFLSLPLFRYISVGFQ